jgi:hypothetical protein
MDFTPQSEEDILNLLPDGEYEFLVKASEKHLSKSGNLSTKLTLSVYDAQGRDHTTFCYLSPNFMFLLKHFCDATGLEDAYATGKVTPEMCLNRTGKCKVIIEQPAEGTNFLPKNVVKDFLKPKFADKDSKPDFVDSDISF